MRIGIVAGGLYGAVRGASVALAASQKSSAGAVFSPLSLALGSLSGAIFGGLAGGISGCSLGVQIGSHLDRYVLANNRCLACRARFNLPS